MKFTCKFQPPLLPGYPRKELEVESFSIGSSTGGRGSEVDISVQRNWAADGASEALMTACANNKSFQEALLTVFAGGGTATHALRLMRVVISSYSQTGYSGSGRISEHFTLTAQSTTSIHPK